MLEQIYQADVTVVDTTSLNPNVFYELGVRHSLVGCVTVIIKRKGTKVPFNIHGLEVIEYDISPGGVEQAKKKIARFVQNGLESQKLDSLVHQSLPIRIAEHAKPFKNTKISRYKLADSDKEIRLITGDILGVKGVDVWVSSENTNMQMARFYENSISGVIRYFGAKKNRARQVTDDTIAKELVQVVGEIAYVPPGEVIATGAGEVERSHKVKRIFHAAAVTGQVGIGFRPIANVSFCIRNAMELADSDEQKDAGIQSILFPMMGTGQGGGSVQETAPKLIETAKSYLEDHPDSRIKDVYFLCWTDKDLEACESALEQAGLAVAGPIEPSPGERRGI
jgi:O-acetyl-ADP-ribose deacetylase (regulator of RNase III)